jgi:hypothetical protein
MTGWRWYPSIFHIPNASMLNANQEYELNKNEVRLHHLGNGRSEQKGVDNGSSDSNHGQSPVKDLLLLTKRNLFRTGILELAAVKAKVAGFTLAVVLVECEEFNGGHSQKDLHIDAKANGIDGTKDVLVGVRISGQMNARLLHQNANNGQHATTKV